MKRRLLTSLTLAAMAGLASAAMAAPGLNLSWNDCGSAGTNNKTFACGANTGSNLAVGSFVAPAGVTGMTGNDVVLDIITTTSPLPAWWDFLNSGACRQASLSMSLALSPTTGSTCTDYWNGQAAGGLTAYRTSTTNNPTPAPNRSRITGSFGVAEAFVGPIDVDVEYFSFNLVINNQKSTGAGNCAGCADPACIVLNMVRITQGVGVGDFEVSDPAANRAITWQSGAPDCNLVPARNRTWGQVKALYR